MSQPRYPTVRVRLDPADAEIAGSSLWDLGATGIEERDGTTLERATPGEILLIAHFEDEASARGACEALLVRWDAEVDFIVGDEWKERYKEFFRPARVGERLVVRPPWETWVGAPSDLVIILDPGQAFGTGTHETTRLVMREIERIACTGAVLDVGCGSGILGIAALLVGARRVVAIDVDPIAVRTARENAAVNDVAIEASATPITEVDDAFALVVANIRTEVLIPMADALVARAQEWLVLSGLLVEEEDDVRRTFDATMVLDARHVDGIWLALTYRKGT